MTSSTASRPRRTARRTPPALLRVLLVAGAATAAVPALAAAAVADDAPEATTSTCQDVTATALGREGTGRVALGGSGLTLVRERDQVRVEGDAATVTGLAVVDPDAGRVEGDAISGRLAVEVYLAGYDHVAVCWDQPVPAVAPDPQPTVRPAQVQVVPQTPATVDGDPLPTRPDTPTAVATTQPGASTRPQVVPDEGAQTATAAVVDPARPATTAVPAATAPATTASPAAVAAATAPPAAAAAAPAAPARDRLATTGVGVEPLAAWSGSAVALGAALVLLRSRAARLRRNR